MHNQGITYQQQGYHLGDGVTLPAHIVLTHKYIVELFTGYQLTEQQKDAIKSLGNGQKK